MACGDSSTTKCTDSDVRRRIRTFSLVSLASVLAVGCQGEDPSPTAAADIRTVLVIDDGIHLDAPALKGRVQAAYTMACKDSPEPADGGTTEAPDTFAAHRAQTIAWLKQKDSSCALVEGIAPKANPLAGAENLKKRWNSTLKANRKLSDEFSVKELEQLLGVLKGVDEASFRGTSTAGLIGADNPNARLVLVERALGKVQTLMANLPCIPQKDIEEATRLMSDPDIEAAFVSRPLSSFDEGIERLVEQHGVQIVNESFGPVARRFLERQFVRNGCFLDFRDYFEVMAALERKRADAHPRQVRLVVRASGDESVQIDGPVDDLKCFARTEPTLIAGVYDVTGEWTSFTNHGSCVDVYAPGSLVLAPAPGGWVLPVSGTNFSASLLVRTITQMNKGQRFDARATWGNVLARRDGQRRLPHAFFPVGTEYDPMKERLEFALVVTEKAQEIREPSERIRLDRRALAQALWPLRQGRR